METLLAASIDAARRGGVIQHASAQQVGMRSMPGNPYDGHTLAETLEQVGILTGTDKLP